MALSTTEQSTLFQIMSLPENGACLIVTALVHWPYSSTQTWNPNYNTGDMSNMVAAIRNLMTTCSAGQETALKARIVDWNTVGPCNPLKVEAVAGGPSGCLVDNDKLRQNIRVEVGNVLGVAVPPGGFLAEVQATYGKSLAPANSLGDR